MPNIPPKAAKTVGGVRRKARKKPKDSKDSKEPNSDDKAVAANNNSNNNNANLSSKDEKPWRDHSSQLEKMESLLDRNFLYDTLSNQSIQTSVPAIVSSSYYTPDVQNHIKSILDFAKNIKAYCDTQNDDTLLRLYNRLLFTRVEHEMFDQIQIEQNFDEIERPLLINFPIGDTNLRISSDVVIDFTADREEEEEEEIFINNAIVDKQFKVPGVLGKLASRLSKTLFRIRKHAKIENKVLRRNELVSQAIVKILSDQQEGKSIKSLYNDHAIIVFYLICLYRGETYQATGRISRKQFLSIYCKCLALADKSRMTGLNTSEECKKMVNYVNLLDENVSLIRFKFYMWIVRWVYITASYQQLENVGVVSEDLYENFVDKTEKTWDFIMNVTI